MHCNSSEPSVTHLDIFFVWAAAQNPKKWNYYSTIKMKKISKHELLRSLSQWKSSHFVHEMSLLKTNHIILKVKRISAGDFCYRVMWRLIPLTIIWSGKIVKKCPSQFPEAKDYVFQIVYLNSPKPNEPQEKPATVSWSASWVWTGSVVSCERFLYFLFSLAVMLVCGETRWHRSGFSNVRIRIGWQFVCLVTTERIKLHPPSPDEADYQSFWVLNLYL